MSIICFFKEKSERPRVKDLVSIFSKEESKYFPFLSLFDGASFLLNSNSLEHLKSGTEELYLKSGTLTAYVVSLENDGMMTGKLVEEVIPFLESQGINVKEIKI